MTFESYVHGFGCVPNPSSYEEARSIVLPMPLEWGNGEYQGVSLGPMAILGASRFIETYDSELGTDPLDFGVATADAPVFDYENLESPSEQIRQSVFKVLSDSKFPLCLGGERTITLPIIKATQQSVGSDFGVIMISRRPGLYERDAGRSLTPLTLGTRIIESVGNMVLLGSRFWSRQEAECIRSDQGPTVVSARQLEEGSFDIEQLSSTLPKNIHLSIDVGVLDPAVLPMPGNHEPGGLRWFTLTKLVDHIFAHFQVRACDISGFVPIIGQVAPSLVVAQLALRCLGRSL